MSDVSGCGADLHRTSGRGHARCDPCRISSRAGNGHRSVTWRTCAAYYRAESFNDDGRQLERLRRHRHELHVLRSLPSISDTMRLERGSLADDKLHVHDDRPSIRTLAPGASERQVSSMRRGRSTTPRPSTRTSGAWNVDRDGHGRQRYTAASSNQDVVHLEDMAPVTATPRVLTLVFNQDIGAWQTGNNGQHVHRRAQHRRQRTL